MKLRRQSSKDMKELSELFTLYRSVSEDLTDEKTRQEVKEIFRSSRYEPVSDCIRRLKTIQKRQRLNPKSPRQIATLQRRMSDDFAIWYYNLDTSNPEHIDEFVRHCDDELAMGVITGKAIGEEIKEIKEWSRRSIRNDQAIYKSIVDKIISGEELSEADLRNVQTGASGILRRITLADGRSWIFPDYGILRLREVYKWVMDLPSRNLELGRCALEGCDHIFTHGSGRYRKKYCSDAHRVRAFRQRKASQAASK